MGRQYTYEKVNIHDYWPKTLYVPSVNIYVDEGEVFYIGSVGGSVQLYSFM